MPGAQTNSRIAAGTINPFTFLQSGATNPQNNSGQLTALQCSGPGVPIIGIAPEWTNNMMGTQAQQSFAPGGWPAATAGQAIRVYGDGEEALLMVGSGYTVEFDNYLVSDASGNGVPINLTSTSAEQWIGAQALEAGVAGDVIRVLVYLRPYLGHA